jgi:hypothetical protein
MFGYWITLFVMEWVVFRGFGLPDGYVFRVWAFADLFGDGAWRNLELLANYDWLAMVIDYALEGLIAFTAIVALSILVSRGILKYFAGIVIICVFLLIWAIVVIAEGVVNGVRVVKEVLRG